MKKHSKVEDELKQKQIQGLYEAGEAEGRFWFLLARVTLAEFAKVGESGFNRQDSPQLWKGKPRFKPGPAPKT